MADEKTSIWKKEISFRRKKGTPVPAAAAPLERPESVADLLLPVAEAAEPEAQSEGIALPPVSPAALAGPPVAAPPALPPPVRPADDETPEDAPADEPAPAVPEVTAVLLPETHPESEPATREKPRKPTRRERKESKRAAKQRARRERALAREHRRGRHVQKRVVGLKIGASQLAAAEIVNKGVPRVAKFARIPLAQGVVVGGEVRDPERLAAELRTLFRKRRLSRKNVRLGIANNRIAVRIFEIAGIEEEKQFANAVRYRAQEALPIPLDEAVLDYQILDDRIDEEGVRQRRVLLVVAHRGLVETYVAACKAAGIKLIGVDLEAFALLRALTPTGLDRATGEDAGLVVVAVGAERSTLAVSDGRSCEYTRVLDWGGSALDIAVARALEIEPREAEPLKRALGLGDAHVAELNAELALRAREAMRTEVHAFARELVASLRFYQEQPGSLGIAEISLTGGGAHLTGLAEELTRTMGVRVSLGDPLAGVKLPRKLRARRSGSVGSLAVAVGLGIEV